MFETSNHSEFNWPCDSVNRHYITEKTLKAILYSKMNIPFIMDMNPYNFIELNKMGFWFLNTEFFDFDNTSSEEILSQNMKNSIFKSVEYVLNIYEHNQDLQQTHHELTKLFSEKMQNNFNIFMEYLYKPYNCEKLIKFILNDE